MRVASLTLCVVPLWITINRLNFIPERVVSGVPVPSPETAKFWVRASRMFRKPLFDSVWHKSTSLANENFATFTGNPVNSVIFLSRAKTSFGRRCDLSVVSDLKTTRTQ